MTQFHEVTLKGRTALVIIPGTVSYFYDVEGLRLAESLRNLGCEVDVCTLHNYSSASHPPYDWCFFLNLSEIGFSFGSVTAALTHVARIKSFCRQSALVLLECAKMTWFYDSYKLFRKCRLDFLIDVGFHDQRNQIPSEARPFYHYFFNGLTRSERKKASVFFTPLELRPVPWACVGHMTPIRQEFLKYMMNHFDREGLIYLVQFTMVNETGPHLNEEQFLQVLRRTRYQVWCSHHPYFYLESIRFRMSLLSGAIPIKVLSTSLPEMLSSPFPYLVHTRESFPSALRTFDFEKVRQKFLDEYCAYPSMETGISNFLNSFGGI